MRGKLVGYCILTAFRRITPADAGKTSPQYRFSASIPDHPRGCGENKGRIFNCRRRKGSPPRMRGKRNNPLIMGTDTGITPADAGKTSRTLAEQELKEDHPRGCGENVYAEET